MCALSRRFRAGCAATPEATVFQIVVIPFCPTITTSVQLKDKWAALAKYAGTLKQGNGKGKKIISSVE